jgi:hypothetical protein
VGTLAEMGAGVDMVSSEMVGAVWCGRNPLLPPRLQLQNKILPSRSRNADTRGILIIPQNPFFGHIKMNKHFVGTIISSLIRCE